MPGNAWVKRWGVAFREDPFMETDYSYNFMRYETLDELRKFFKHGNWAIRYGAVYENLCFVQQVNGGDEWWVIKKFPDGELIGFESISFAYTISNPKPHMTFEAMVDYLLKATKEQCINGGWSVLEDNMKFPFYMDPGHGWLRIPIRLLRELGIESRITLYSYRRGDYAYLEEDCDAMTFIKAMEARGRTVEFDDHTADRASKIRRYEPWDSIIDHSRCRRCNKPVPRLVLKNGLCKVCRRELKLPVLEDTHERNGILQEMQEGHPTQESSANRRTGRTRT